MCGRYAASASQDLLTETFVIEEIVDPVEPRWNIAPTDLVPAVVDRVDHQSGRTVRKLVTPRWGLVPSWSKSAGGGARMINARLETVTEKPAFRTAAARRRCLLPADGYYEWYATGATAKGRPVKQPFFIHPPSGLLVMAGLYEFWKDPSDQSWLTTCTIITTTATDALGVIHDRMPVIVGRQAWSSWLDPHLTDPLEAVALLDPAAGEALTAYAVGPEVGSVAHDGPQLIEPLPSS